MNQMPDQLSTPSAYLKLEPDFESSRENLSSVQGKLHRLMEEIDFQLETNSTSWLLPPLCVSLSVQPPCVSVTF